MEKYVEKEKMHTKYKSGAIICFIYAVIFLLVFVVGMLINFQYKEENLVTYEGIITSQTYDEEKERWDIELKDYDIDFRINGKDNYNLSVGKEVKFITPENGKENIRNICEIEMDNKVVYDNIQGNRTAGIVLSIVGPVGAVILTTVGIYLLKHQKTGKMIKANVSHINLMIRNEMIITKIKGYNCYKEDRRMKIGSLASLVCFCAGIPGIILPIIYLDSLTLKIIIPVFSGLLICASFVCITVVSPSINLKKQIKLFTEDYHKYLNSSFTMNEESAFTEQGLNIGYGYTLDDEIIDQYIKDGNQKELERLITIPYDQLNFYIAVTYSGQFEMARVYLCTDIDNENILKADIATYMDNETYQLIRKYNIKVRGLDYFLEHTEEEIIKNTTKAKFKEAANNEMLKVVVDYKDQY